MKCIRIIIAGSRTITDYKKFKYHCLKALEKYKDYDITIVSGGAKGVDKLGERLAKEEGYRLSVYPANWEKYGKKAGYIRNIEMAKNADALIAVWDGKSKGTAHMIDIAKQYGLLTYIIRTQKGSK